MNNNILMINAAQIFCALKNNGIQEIFSNICTVNIIYAISLYLLSGALIIKIKDIKSKTYIMLQTGVNIHLGG